MSDGRIWDTGAAHDADCESKLTDYYDHYYCGCSYRASLVALEREREEDRQAIRALSYSGECHAACDSCRLALQLHAAAIERAQERP